MYIAATVTAQKYKFNNVAQQVCVVVVCMSYVTQLAS